MTKLSEQEKKVRIYQTNQAYQNNHLLNFDNPVYKERVGSFIENMLKNDIGKEDITSKYVIQPNQAAKAIISSEEKGVVAGIEELIYYYESKGVNAKQYLNDGDKISKGQAILELEGNAQTILSMERVGLNIIRRMSGIATITREYVNQLRPYHTQVAATRKTYMEELLEKKAVYLGGGLTHRIGLDRFIMIKDCHLDLLKAEGVEKPITEAIKRAEKSFYVPLEIEVKNLTEAKKAAKAIMSDYDHERRYVIMFDNMSPMKISKALEQLKDYRRFILFEASGGITLDNAKYYAETGVDVISTSEITEKTNSLNIHQKIII